MYMPSYDEITFWGKVLVAIGSAITGIGAIFKYAIIPLYYWIIELQKRIIDDYTKWCNLADTATLVHDIITKELQTNGGSSIKDALKRIENRLSFISNKVKTILSMENEPIWESDELG